MGGPWQRSALFAKKVVFFFRAGSGGLIQPIATFANRKSTSNHHPTVAGWLAGCLEKVAGWLRHHRWYPVSRHWVDANFCARAIRAIRLDRNCVSFWRHLQSWCLDRSWWGEPQPHYKVSFKMCHQTWEILMKTFFLLVRSSTNVFFFLVPYLMTGSLKSERWGRTQQIGSPAQVELASRGHICNATFLVLS